MRWSARLGLRRVICVSEAVREGCIESGYPPGQVEVVHNGLPFRSGDAPRQRGGATGAVRLGFLGVLSEGKGIDGLLAMVGKLGEGTDWRLVIAGEPPDAGSARLVEDLKARFRSAPWWNRVQWCGWVKEPIEFLGSLDLLIFPSRMFDSFPTVLLEAGLAGVPVLASRIGGVAEIIDDGRTGWLFPPNDWDEAARRLSELLGDPDGLSSAGSAAATRIGSLFSVDKMVAKYFKVYSDVIRYG
jgi:glycosyltransferase involved in cell wall biosynthesis